MITHTFIRIHLNKIQIIMNYIINLFGTGIRYWQCEVDQNMFDDMNRIRLKNKVEWEQLLFDLDFLNHYGFSHWSELSTSPGKVGFLLNAQNRIEIKNGSKRLMRFQANELDTETTLFPLYRTAFMDEPIIEKSESKCFTLLQFEKGLIGKYKFETETFSIEQMNYVLSTIGTTKFLASLKFGDTRLESTQEDCLVIGGEVVFYRK